jgi:negative regulator of genetic competence, sporulation and motility
LLIEQLSDICVKFTLTQNELKTYNLEFNDIGRYDLNTRAMISNLIDLAENSQDISINFGSNEVYVEAFMCSNENCIIYISLIVSDRLYKYNPPKEFNFFMCKSQNLKHLVRMSAQLMKFSIHGITSSSLYLQSETFILLIDCTSETFESIMYTLAEFCEYSTKRPNLEHLNEHWQSLAQGNAIQRLNLLNS